MNIRISGNLKGPTVIFLAGWPDTCDVFHNNLMTKLKSSYRIIGLTLPGFDDDLPFVRQYHDRIYQAKQKHFAGLNTLANGANGSSSSSTDKHSSKNEAATGSKSNFHTGVGPNISSYSSILGSSLSGLTLAKTPRCGYSFIDLLALLEIAVDVSLENHNYFRSSQVSLSQGRDTSNIKGNEASARPILITHGWGCLLANEFLLVRPHALSKVVFLDVGGSIFQHAEVERCIRSYFDGGLSVSAQMDRRLSRREKMRLLLLAQNERRRERQHSKAHQQSIRLQHGKVSGTSRSRVVPSAHEVSEKKGCFSARELKDGSGAFLRFWLWWCHALVVVCLFCVPRPIANIALRFFLWIVGRPSYWQDSTLRLSTETETFNYRLEVQRYYSQSYYSGKGHSTSATRNEEDHSAFTTLHHPRVGTPEIWYHSPFSATCGTFDIPRHCGGNTEGWQIILFPFLKTDDDSDDQDGNQKGGGGRGEGPPRYTSSGRRRRHLATEFTEDVTLTQRYRTSSKGGRAKGPRVVVVRRGYAKGSVNVNREKSSVHTNSDGVNPYYSAYFPTGARRVFQDSTNSGAFSSRKNENVYNSTTRTLFRKWEVVYKEYYIPPSHASHPPEVPKSGTSIAVHPKKQHGSMITGHIHRSWKRVQKYIKIVLDLICCIQPKSRKTTDDEIEEEEEEEEQDEELRQEGSMNNMWIVRAEQRMGWLFLRYSCGCILSRLFSPKGNWAPPGFIQALQKHWRQEVRLRKRRSNSFHEEKGVCEWNPTKGVANPISPAGVVAGDGIHTNSFSTSSSLGCQDFTPYQYMHSPLVSQRFFLPLHVPILFMYGGGKRCMLHSRQWAEYVQCKGLADGQSRVVCVEGGGHWFFAEPRHREEVADEVVDFITQ